MKLLIVDDSKAMRMIILRTIRQAGFSDIKTVEASNGVEALEKVASEKPDLILSDWNMPEMKGIDLLKKLREDGCTIPLGFITSESGTDIANEAAESGAEFIITKPFNAEKFEAVLSPILT
ncbi:MAG: response regulator [Planctomycetales bacterium]|nr:response regulator [Planctomycetales bacterium]